MKIILEDEEAEAYLLNREIDQLKTAERQLRKLHDRFRADYDEFEITDLCNKIENILISISINKLVKINNDSR